MLVPGLLVIDVTGLTGPRVLPDVVGLVVTGLEPACANFDDPEKSSPSTSFVLRRPLPESSAIVPTMCSKDMWPYFYVLRIHFRGVGNQWDFTEAWRLFTHMDPTIHGIQRNGTVTVQEDRSYRVTRRTAKSSDRIECIRLCVCD